MKIISEPIRLPNNFIDDYKLYSASEAPDIYNHWLGISCIAAAVSRKVYYLLNDGLPLYPNFYIALVGTAGARKGTAMSYAKPLIKNLENIQTTPDIATREALINQFMSVERTVVLNSGLPYTFSPLQAFIPELMNFLGDGRNPLFLTALTDWFDNPDVWEYRTQSRGNEAINGLYLSLVGGITPDLLKVSLGDALAGSGLRSRLILVYAPNTQRRIAFPRTQQQYGVVHKPKLEAHLKRISSFEGEIIYDTSWVEIYTKWYETESKNDIVCKHYPDYETRRAIHLIKTAICYMLAEYGVKDMVLSSRHFVLAKDSLAQVERSMLEQRGMFSNPSNVLMEAVLVALRPMDLDFKQLLGEVYGHIKSIQELRDVLFILEAGNVIARTTRNSYYIIQKHGNK